MYRRTILLTIAVVVVFAGCASRYRLSLYLNMDESRRSLKIEQSQYLVNAKLGDPYGEQKVLTGDGTCLVLLTSARGDKVELPSKSLLSFDEYLKIRFFVELPNRIKTGTIDLKGHSFVQLLGRYTLQPEEKIFLVDSGTMIVDSIVKEHLFATVKGHYFNAKSRPLVFDGQFRAKIRK